ncbi:unnamed protein product [Arabidopsis thaliana]|uniref:Uncharacterized protein n=1 Tax=Arabidopsis thaliana TaxID=3702 RepID=Q9LIJ1_ARATH|nr:unnamed protein product [Arabidopsis thaliana]
MLKYSNVKQKQKRDYRRELSLTIEFIEEALSLSQNLFFSVLEQWGMLLSKKNHRLRCLKVSGAVDGRVEGDFVGNAEFRWQRVLLMRSSAYYPKYGIGAFAVYPLISKITGKSSEEYRIMGLRYGSTNLSVGATVTPFSANNELPKHAWLVSKMGSLTVGVQYEPLHGSKDLAKYTDPRNWSCAAGYGVGSQSPLTPSFNIGIELARSSQFSTSLAQYEIDLMDLEQVQNPFEENQVVGITNYIDFGFELQSRFFIAGGCVLAGQQELFAEATTNHRTGNVQCGFGLRVDNLREASYQRADPNFVMLTPNKEHLAEGIVWKMGKRPMYQADVDAENFSELPKELRPSQKIL